MNPSAGVKRIAPPAALILSIISSKKCAYFVTVRFSVVISTEVRISITAYFIAASSYSRLDPIREVIAPESAVRVFVVTLSASTLPINLTPFTYPSAMILPPTSPSFLTVISPPSAVIF